MKTQSKHRGINYISNIRRPIRQFDIVLVDLGDNGVLHEKKGKRPCVVLSNNLINNTSSNILVAPMTKFSNKKGHKPLSTHISMLKSLYPTLPHSSVIQLEDMRSISKIRILLTMGRLERETIIQLRETLPNIFAKSDGRKYVKRTK